MENVLLTASGFNNITPNRDLNLTYIILDICFLVFFCALLIINKKHLTLFYALAGGVLYFIVDYGIFYHALHSRVIVGADYFWFLLWLSMSYGITNFAWIWLWLSRDKRLLEWSLLILAAWLAIPLISVTFGGESTISIYRTTDKYHGVMAILLFVGYAILCVYNILQKDKARRVNIFWILAIGILVQLGWEFMLLITGIRSAGIETLIVNSLLETNMGLPYMFFIHKAVTMRRNEDLSKRLPLAGGGTV